MKYVVKTCDEITFESEWIERIVNVRVLSLDDL